MGRKRKNAQRTSANSQAHYTHKKAGPTRQTISAGADSGCWGSSPDNRSSSCATPTSVAIAKIEQDRSEPPKDFVLYREYEDILSKLKRHCFLGLVGPRSCLGQTRSRRPVPVV